MAETTEGSRGRTRIRSVERKEGSRKVAQGKEMTLTRNSGNVFADLGLDNPEDELAKAKLVSAMAEVIGRMGMTQAKVAALVGVDQPTVSKLLRGRTSGFSIGRLMRLLCLLEQDIEISVCPRDGGVGRVNVSVVGCPGLDRPAV